jgi:hypothetical protein
VAAGQTFGGLGNLAGGWGPLDHSLLVSLRGCC